MYTTAQRTQLRAALHLWLTVAEHSAVHPSEVPLCKAEFLLEGVQPLTTVQIEAMIHALATEVVYTTVTLAAEKYKVPKGRLKRMLDTLDYKPVPGSKVYSMSDVIVAINYIKDKDDHGFFG